MPCSIKCRRSHHVRFLGGFFSTEILSCKRQVSVWAPKKLGWTQRWPLIQQVLLSHLFSEQKTQQKTLKEPSSLTKMQSSERGKKKKKEKAVQGCKSCERKQKPAPTYTVPSKKVFTPLEHLHILSRYSHKRKCISMRWWQGSAWVWVGREKWYTTNNTERKQKKKKVSRSWGSRATFHCN